MKRAIHFIFWFCITTLTVIFIQFLVTPVLFILVAGEGGHGDYLFSMMPVKIMLSLMPIFFLLPFIYYRIKAAKKMDSQESVQNFNYIIGWIFLLSAIISLVSIMPAHNF